MCVCIAVGVELMEKATLSSAQVIIYCRPFTKKGGEKFSQRGTERKKMKVKSRVNKEKTDKND